jgi:hypothetical protein
MYFKKRHFSNPLRIWIMNYRKFVLDTFRLQFYILYFIYVLKSVPRVSIVVTVLADRIRFLSL